MPQVTILEGGKPKSFAGVDKLQIALSGGGTSLWVPKDTRLLTALTANVNGTYPPPEGYFGFDTVIVNVPPSQVAGIDPETGQYIVVGYKKVESENPSWPTGSEGGGSEDDPWDPDTDGGYGWDPWEVPDGGDWEPPSEWPTTENEFTQERIPSGIKIVQPPTKTQYTVGETIDYSGIVVQLLDGNGNVFTDATYPSGTVPFSELIFPVEEAPESAQESISEYGSRRVYYRTGTKVSCAMTFSTGPYAETYEVVGGEGPFYAFGTAYTTEGDPAPKMSRGCFLCSPKTFLTKASWHSDSGGAWPYSYTMLDKTVYYYGRQVADYYFRPVVDAPINDSTFETEDGNTVGLIAWIICYGHVEGSQGTVSVPVQWNSTYDGKLMSDSFLIRTTKSGESDPEGGGGGFSGGGGEGIGGEGGGGGF